LFPIYQPISVHPTHEDSGSVCTGDVFLPAQIPADLDLLVELCDVVLAVCRVRDVLDVLERLVLDLVALGQHVHAQAGDVDEDVVVLVERVRVGVRGAAAALEVLAAHEAGVDVDV
jgi:hypothetical protein